MISRYESRAIGTNDDELYDNVFRARNVNFIRQYRSGTLRHPTAGDISTLDLIGHTWTTGDRFYKLAQKYYGHSELWWVIAWFNRTPTESHLKLGDPIQIPMSLERILGMLNV